MPRAPRSAVAAPALLAAALSAAALAVGCAGEPARAAAPAAPAALPAATLRVEGTDPAEVADLEPLLRAGMTAVSDALDRPWVEPLTATIVPDRPAFTASFPPEYGVTETQCWMVAWAVADRLTLLSPGAWRADACEHDPDDRESLTLLLRHELVHALHGQHNPTRDFTGMEEELGWFCEGLATFASGQLEAEHAGDARQALAAGAGPKQLATAWSGRYRYGVCGSLVAYLDHRCGAAKLREMHAATTLPQLLAIAGLSEQELLAAWADWAR